jgi:hypothetical protein
MSQIEVPYGRLDRIIHRLAMKNLEMQRGLSELEDKRFSGRIAGVYLESPVFITSLPRAGTTLLLEILAESGHFGAHTYRDMPFLLCPLVWNSISRRFRKRAVEKQRAHGDGMLVSFDSHEAFEEVIWREFWPEHFEADRIKPWSAEEKCGDGKFTAFFRQHMRKVVYLRSCDVEETGPQRYVSKNNGNIARIEWIARNLPGAKVIIPYRDPLSQVASLAKQHCQFLEAHKASPFVLEYMRDIGHFEFGRAALPIDFDGWHSKGEWRVGSNEYWCEYWIATFSRIAKLTDKNVITFSYYRLCSDPEQSLSRLADSLGLASNAFSFAMSRFRPPTTYASPNGISNSMETRIKEVLYSLNQNALF